MLPSLRERDAACADCGAAAGGDQSWCGACGGLVTRRPGPASSLEERDEQVDDRSSTRSWWVAAGVCAAVVALVAGTLATTGRGDVASGGPGTTLLGRADDGTDRSNTADPAPDLVQRWISTGDDWWWGADLPLAALDEETLLAGDRLLSIDDGSVLGASHRASAARWGATSPDGLAGVADGGVLRIVEAATGDQVGSVRLPGDATDSWFVTGWLDGLVLLTRFPGGVADAAAPEAEGVAVEVASGRVRWRVPGEIGQLVGDGWFLSWAVAESGRVRPVLTDGRTGERSSEVTLDGDRLAGEPVVADGVVYVPEQARLVAWELGTGDRLWARPIDGGNVRVLVDGDELQVLTGGFEEDATVTWLDRSTGAVTHEEHLRVPAGDASWSFSYPVDQVGGLVVARSDSGVQVRRRDDRGWSRAIPDTIAVAAVDHGRGLVAVVTGTAQRAREDGTWTLLGDAAVHVFDRDGEERFTVPVGAGSFVPPVRFAAGLDGRLLLSRGTRFPVVAQASGVDLATGRRTDASEPLARWTSGTLAASATVVAGVVPGGPGPGGPAPLLWHGGDGGLAIGDGLVSLPVAGPLPPVPPVAVDGRLAVATMTGTAVVPLPSPGEARRVDDAVSLAVGVDRSVTGTSRRHDVVAGVEVDDVAPLAAVDDLLLVVEGAADGAEPGTLAGRLAAVDPVTGARAWTSDLVVSAWDLGGELPWVDDGEGARRATSVLHDDGTTIVLVAERRVVAIDRRTGEQVWSVEHDRPIVVGGVLLGDTVVIGTSLGVRSLEVATGEQRWRYTPDDLVTAIGGAGATALVGTAGGEVVAVDDDGRRVDHWAGPPVRVDDVAVLDGMVVLAHADGSTTGFGPPPTDVDRDDVVELSEGP